MEWYYAEGDQRRGPISRAELLAERAAGRIAAETLVWRRGMSDWTPFRDVEREISDRPEAPPLPAGIPSAPPPDSAVSVGPERAELRYSGFWIRFVAYLLDGLALVALLTVVDLALAVVLSDPGVLTGRAAAEPRLRILDFLVRFFGSGLYTTLFLGKYGATPGKMALGLQVVRPDGSPIGYRRAACRFLAEILSVLTLYIGYIMAAFDSRKRALHDRICETRVIYE